MKAAGYIRIGATSQSKDISVEAQEMQIIS